MAIVRKTGKRSELDAMWALLNFAMYGLYAALSSGAIGNGGTAGRLRITASTDFAIGGLKYTKASTDDLWNLSAQTDTIAGQYRAFWLYLDVAGTASIAAGANATSADDALKALPDLDKTKSVIGVYVAGPSTDFDAAGGLAAQGTIHNRVPVGVPGVPAGTVIEPATLVAV